MSHRRGATGSVTAPQTQSRTDGPVARPEGLETPWLRLYLGLGSWLLLANDQPIAAGTGQAVDFRRCPFGRAM